MSSSSKPRVRKFMQGATVDTRAFVDLQQGGWRQRYWTQKWLCGVRGAEGWNTQSQR